MEMRTYSCVLVSKANPLHQVPIENVTKQEIQLLAFIHGVESLPTDKIKPLGLNRVVAAVDDNGVATSYVESDMDEYRRLAHKYDTRVNPGRGKRYVEDCFKVKLDGFDHILSEVNAIDAMDAAVSDAERAAAREAVEAGVKARIAIEEKAAGGSPQTFVGSKVFGGAPQPM